MLKPGQTIVNQDTDTVSVLIIPESIPCPHCGERIPMGYIGKYFGKITGIKENESKKDESTGR
jgi:hypothetical protein